MRSAIPLLAIIVTLWWMAVIIVSLLQCRPLKALWDPDVKGSCISTQKFFYGNSIPNIVTDAALIALPVHLVLQLPLELSHRIALVFAFALGGL